MLICVACRGRKREIAQLFWVTVQKHYGQCHKEADIEMDYRKQEKALKSQESRTMLAEQSAKAELVSSASRVYMKSSVLVLLPDLGPT